MLRVYFTIVNLSSKYSYYVDLTLINGTLMIHSEKYIISVLSTLIWQSKIKMLVSGLQQNCVVKMYYWPTEYILRVSNFVVEQ